jgi:hypothetical protein
VSRLSPVECPNLRVNCSNGSLLAHQIILSELSPFLSWYVPSLPCPFIPPPAKRRQVEIILNEEIAPLLPTGIGERYSQTISNLGHAALLRRCELPL